MNRKNIVFRVLVFIFITLSVTSAQAFTTNYNMEDSKQYNHYCVITFCDPKIILNWTCKICSKTPQLSDITYIDNKITNIVAYTGYHQDRNAILMVFRATQDVKNWIQDLSMNQTNYLRCSGCKVHQGFYLSYLSIAVQLQTAIQKLMKKYPEAIIISVGTSLGASIASIAAVEIQVLFGKVEELHTLGSPRTGNSNFAGFLNKKINLVRRVIHNRDIIPHLPLVSQNYSHPYQQILLSQNFEQYKQCDLIGQDPNCSNSYYPNYTVMDHSYFIQFIISQICG